MDSLEKRIAVLRSKSLRSLGSTEKEVRATYKKIMKDLQGFVAEEYARLSKDGKLNYSVLQQKGEYARFLEEVTNRLDGVAPDIKSEITKLVNDTYELAYKEMVNAVSKAGKLEDELKSVKATIPETVKRNTENPINKLTLKDTLEYNRAGITYNIRKQVGIGLVNGDRYETMAKRIADSLDGDYKKSILIARTEAHKVREQGLNDAAQECSDAVDNGKNSLVMVKVWRTGQDGRVRDTHAAMEGVTVLTDEEFELPSGATTLTPGNSGVASEDINCRCYCAYKLMTIGEYEKVSGGKIDQKLIDRFYNKAKGRESKITNTLKQAVNGTNGKLEGIDYRIKTKESFERKVVKEKNESNISTKAALNRMYDTVRYTSVSKPSTIASDYLDITSNLEGNGYKVLRVKNTFDDKGAAYKGVNCVLEDETGYKFELQFHTDQSFKLKNGILHELYEKERLETTPLEEKIKLRKQMKEISDSIVVPDNINKIKKFNLL